MTNYKYKIYNAGKLIVNESSRIRATQKFYNIQKCGVIVDKFGKKIKVNLTKNF